MVAVAGVHDDVPDAVLGAGLDQVHGDDHAALLADHVGHLAQHVLTLVDLDADCQAVLRAGCDVHGAVLQLWATSLGGPSC